MLYVLYDSKSEQGAIDGSMVFREFLCFGHVAHVVRERRVHGCESLDVKCSPDVWSVPVPCDGSCKERYVTRCPGVPAEIHAACVSMLET